MREAYHAGLTSISDGLVEIANLVGSATWIISDLLAETGRTEEAVAVLEPHVPTNCGSLVGHLIDLGRVKDTAALLQQRKSEPVASAWTGTLSTAPPL
ncbi:hypothetical protein [Streptomyces brasiliensis]|uniref:Tetratricopeptide repeat protein n=1 Tax=Streptomyces brasiliensis TaxID=1954 RepID=A0A917LBJ6_9ACTN|nr:hypothetical protein [Streptomyces brasiliensis]GGJ56129.1 hypothetical protein GCM10010121_078390 [Streptomyces brasiliensis]